MKAEKAVAKQLEKKAIKEAEEALAKKIAKETEEAAVKKLEKEAAEKLEKEAAEKASKGGHIEGPITPKTDYSSIPDPDEVKIGGDFTKSQKEKAIELNKTTNGGVVKSDKSGTVLSQPKKSQRGVTPDPNEWQLDHIKAKNKGGSNASSNIQILSRQENRIKSDN